MSQVQHRSGKVSRQPNPTRKGSTVSKKLPVKTSERTGQKRTNPLDGVTDFEIEVYLLDGFYNGR